MGIQINIKNAAARALADQLTQQTGESVTEAVTEALRLRLKILNRDRIKAEWDAIAAENRERLKNEPEWPDHSDFLYDDMGLPK